MCQCAGRRADPGGGQRWAAWVDRCLACLAARCQASTAAPCGRAATSRCRRNRPSARGRGGVGGATPAGSREAGSCGWGLAGRSGGGTNRPRPSALCPTHHTNHLRRSARTASPRLNRPPRRRVGCSRSWQEREAGGRHAHRRCRGGLAFHTRPTAACSDGPGRAARRIVPRRFDPCRPALRGRPGCVKPRLPGVRGAWAGYSAPTLALCLIPSPLCTPAFLRMITRA